MFNKVLDRYVQQIAKQLKRRNRRDQGNGFTSNEQKAIAYYSRAAQQLKALNEAPKPEWVRAEGKFVRL
jgi:hypothetical protein